MMLEVRTVESGFAYTVYTRSIYPFMMYCGKIKGADQYAGVKAEVLFHR